MEVKTSLCLGSTIIILLVLGLVDSETCKTPLDLSGSDMDIVKQLTDPCRYDKLSRPSRNDKTTVYVHLHVCSIGPIDTQNLQFTAHIIMQSRWLDPRLQKGFYFQYESGQTTDRIWFPHIYMVNEQESSSQRDVTNSIQADGTVIRLSRIKTTLRCAMNLQKFPFDSQQCPLIIESWSYNSSQLELEWEKDNPLTLDGQLDIPEYTLVATTTNSSVTEYSWHNSAGMTSFYGKAANFSTLTVKFALQRQYGFHIMDYYVPSIMIVVVSWVSFWLDANSTPGRTVLGTSTLLTFITLSKNIGNSLPKVSYIKSSEIWFIGCCGFIFSSLAEFAFVNIIWRRRKDITLKKVTSKHILQSTITPQIYRKHLDRSTSFPSISSMTDSQYGSTLDPRDINQLTVQSFNALSTDPHALDDQTDPATVTFPIPNQQTEAKSLLTMTPQEIANWIDRRSRLLFPIAFLIFNCVYWTWSLVLF